MKKIYIAKGGTKMEYRFTPQGVCSQEMVVVIEDGIIKDAKIIGGCAGNTTGLTRLTNVQRQNQTAGKRMKYK